MNSSSYLAEFKFASPVDKNDVSTYVSSRQDQDDFREALVQLKQQVLSHFGQKTKVYIGVYRNGSPDMKKWEVLLELESHWRPEAFAEKLSSFDYPLLTEYPVDVCRYRKNKRRVGLGNI